MDSLKTQLLQACDLNDKEKEKRKEAVKNMKETVVSLDLAAAENEKLSSEIEEKTKSLKSLSDQAELDKEKISKQEEEIQTLKARGVSSEEFEEMKRKNEAMVEVLVSFYSRTYVNKIFIEIKTYKSSLPLMSHYLWGIINIPY